MFLKLAPAFFILVCATAFASHIILPPQSSFNNPAALVLVGGALVPSRTYTTLALKLQTAAALAEIDLWIASVHSHMDLPVLGIQKSISAAVHLLFERGLSTGSPLFLAGHSLGGTKVQDYIAETTGSVKNPLIVFQGLVILCSPLQRKYRADKNGTFPQIPILTLGGSDDGLMRITRMAEAFYHGVSQSPTRETKFSKKAVSESPVIVLEGVNHWQFASGIEPLPVNVRENVRCYLYVFAMSYNLPLRFRILLRLPPHPMHTTLRSETRDCWVGSEWSERAQRYMAGIDEEPLMHLLGEKYGRAGVSIEDEVHKVWVSRPLHLPVLASEPLHNHSTQFQKSRLYLSTVSQPVYHPADAMDTGFFPVAATEIRTKMSTRQRVYELVLDSKQDFESLDTQMRCAEINSLAIEHAYGVIREMGQVGARVLDRFAALGTELVPVSDDGSMQIGPQWIWTPLQVMKVERNGRVIAEVRSPMMKTPTDFVVKFFQGFRYCKLHGPARVLEWIWIESVRGIK